MPADLSSSGVSFGRLGVAQTNISRLRILALGVSHSFRHLATRGHPHVCISYASLGGLGGLAPERVATTFVAERLRVEVLERAGAAE